MSIMENVQSKQALQTPDDFRPLENLIHHLNHLEQDKGILSTKLELPMKKRMITISTEQSQLLGWQGDHG